MITRIGLTLILCLLALASRASDDKERGANAANAGRYSEAYRLWEPLAEQGDAEVQEAVALLLVSDNDLGMSLTKADRQRLALRWVVRSAKGGRKSAMKWLGQTFQYGWLGVAKNQKTATCWLAASEMKRDVSTCQTPLIGSAN